MEIFDELQPDVIVEDNVVSFPALPASGRPWVRIVSCNPAEVKDPEVAPAFSGYPAADRAQWDDFGRSTPAPSARCSGRSASSASSAARRHCPSCEFMHDSDG